jgi:hypothetical protein
MAPATCPDFDAQRTIATWPVPSPQSTFDVQSETIAVDDAVGQCPDPVDFDVDLIAVVQGLGATGGSIEDVAWTPRYRRDASAPPNLAKLR